MCLSIFLLDTSNIQTISKLKQHRIYIKKKKKKVLASQKSAKFEDNPNGQCSLQLHTCKIFLFGNFVCPIITR